MHALVDNDGWERACCFVEESYMDSGKCSGSGSASKGSDIAAIILSSPPISTRETERELRVWWFGPKAQLMCGEANVSNGQEAGGMSSRMYFEQSESGM
jgi:hypothetical protein